MKQKYAKLSESLLHGIVEAVRVRLSHAEQFDEDQRFAIQRISEYERAFEFLNNHSPKDIAIVLKSKSRKEAAELSLFPVLVRKLKAELEYMVSDKITGEINLRERSVRKRGGQSGARLRNLQRKDVARRLYRVYLRYYPNKRRVFHFIADVFTRSGFPTSPENAKKLVELIRWNEMLDKQGKLNR